LPRRAFGVENVLVAGGLDDDGLGLVPVVGEDPFDPELAAEGVGVFGLRGEYPLVNRRGVAVGVREVEGAVPERVDLLAVPVQRVPDFEDRVAEAEGLAEPLGLIVDLGL
jgi:hypothetical protein